MTINDSAKGIGLSFKKQGGPEFVLYPDSVLGSYYLFSPFLDSLKLLSFQANPLFKPKNVDSFLIAMVRYEGAVVEDFRNFDKSKWAVVKGQASDSISFDTVNTLWGYPLFVFKTSNSANTPVKSYIYQNIDTPLKSQSTDPFIRMVLYQKNPFDTSTEVHIPRKPLKTVHSNLIRTSEEGSLLKITCSVPALSKEKLKNVNISIIDLFGKIVKSLDRQSYQIKGETISTIWDKCNENGRIVSKGLYIAKIYSGKQRLGLQSFVLR